MIKQKFTIVASILLFAVSVAGVILVRTEHPTKIFAGAAANTRWIQTAGEGIAIPACGSSSTALTCDGGKAYASATWTDGGNPWGYSCVTAQLRARVVGTPDWTVIADDQLCNESTLPIEANSYTNYEYEVNYKTASDGFSTFALEHLIASENLTTPQCAPPSGLTASCPPPEGNSATLSWNALPGITTYHLRVDNLADGWDGSCASPAGDFCVDVVGTSHTFVSMPGASYTWIVQPKNDSGIFGAETAGPGFTCYKQKADLKPNRLRIVDPVIEVDLILPLMVGQPVKFKGRTKNIGDANADAFRTRFCLDNPDCLNSTVAGITLGEPSIPQGIDVAQTRTKDSDTWNAGPANSTHTIYFCADIEKIIDEHQETNNCISRALTVGAPNAPPVAEAGISKDGINFSQHIDVIKGQPTPLWFSADKDIDDNDLVSYDPNGTGPNQWDGPQAMHGLVTGGRCEWNSNLDRQIADPWEDRIETGNTKNNPPSPSACNLNFFITPFNDAAGTYTYDLLRLVDKPGLPSNIAQVSVTVKTPPAIQAMGPDHQPLINLNHSHGGAMVFDEDSNLANFTWAFTACPGACPAIAENGNGSWATGSGNPAVAVPAPKFIPNEEGAYTLRLTVTDADGLSAVQTVVENARNEPPAIDIGPAHPLSAGVTHSHFGASATDANNNLKDYAWAFTACPGACPAIAENQSGSLPPEGGAVPSPRFTPENRGDYILRLTVTDLKGKTTSAAVTETAIGTILEFSATPNTIAPGQNTVLTWDTAGFDSCTMTDNNPSETDIGPVATDGTATVSPDVTTTYTLTCNPGGTSRSIVITVSGVPKFKEIKPQ